MNGEGMCKIQKTVITYSGNGLKLQEQTLTVEGQTLKEVEKAFDKRWKK